MALYVCPARDAVSILLVQLTLEESLHEDSEAALATQFCVRRPLITLCALALQLLNLPNGDPN